MIVCVECNRQMRPKQNGFLFVETTETNDPYKIWHSDLWECQDCNKTVAYTDHRQLPIMEHHQPGFLERVAQILVSARPWTRG
jgi:hypothetical protein